MIVARVGDKTRKMPQSTSNNSDSGERFPGTGVIWVFQPRLGGKKSSWGIARSNKRGSVFVTFTKPLHRIALTFTFVLYT